MHDDALPGHRMDDTRISALVATLAAGGPAADAAALELRDFGPAVVPALAAAYETTGRWQGRAALLFHAIRYARTSDAAVALGKRALTDRATIVRYRACGLLAYSLRRDVLPDLRPLLAHADAPTRADAAAAITAIERGNHHRFIDRDGSGNSFWHVNPGDTPDEDDDAPEPWWRRSWRLLTGRSS